MEADETAAAARGVAAAVLGGIVLAATVNVPQFVILERLITDEYEALRVKDGHEPDDLVARHFESTKLDVELYSQLRSVAPGASYVVPVDGTELLSEETLVGLSLADGVVVVAEDPVVVGGESADSVAAHVVATGTDEVLGPYAIAVLDDEVEELTVADLPQGRWVVDVRLLTDSSPGDGS